MNSDLFNILSQSKNIDQQKLIDYLQDKLSPEEKHEIEKLLIDAEFESDAAEGLAEVKDKQQLPVVLNEMNKQLVQKLSKRRKKTFLKKPLPNILIPAVTTIIILLLIMMLYLWLRKHMG